MPGQLPYAREENVLAYAQLRDRLQSVGDRYWPAEAKLRAASDEVTYLTSVLRQLNQRRAQLELARKAVEGTPAADKFASEIAGFDAEIARRQQALDAQVGRQADAKRAFDEASDAADVLKAKMKALEAVS